MYWLAILITIVSSTSCSVGKALQKEATRHLPRFAPSDPKILSQYLQSRLWVTGLAADLGGAVMQIAAFALAPVRPSTFAAAAAGCWLHACVPPSYPSTALQAKSFFPRCCRLLPQVSIVQPVSGVGLVGLAVYSHLFLRERLHAVEWAAVALAGVGTLGLGATRPLAPMHL